METFDYEFAQITDAAEWLVAACGHVPVWLFEGEMGAGKTTLIKAVCEVLGVQSTVQSPTFSIVNEYATKSGQAVYHFDCYRLKHEAEAFDIGIEEYFYSGDYCFVEWPSRIPNLLPSRYVVVSISVTGPRTRCLHLSPHTA